MDLAGELARTCVMNSSEKRADFASDREDFEASTTKEQVLRRHAARLGELVKSRSAEEDKSLGGYASTGLSRALVPIPQTPLEALVRAPIMGAGGVAGYQLGKSMESLSPDALSSVFSPASQTMEGKKGKEGPLKKIYSAILERNIQDRRLGKAPAKRLTTQAQRVFSDLQFQQPKVLQELFGGAKEFPGVQDIRSEIRTRGMPKSLADVKSYITALKPRSVVPQHRLHGELESVLGTTGRQQLQDQVKALVRSGKDLPQGSRLPRYLGLAGGLGTTALATGLPMALNALWQKSTGGEAAARSRSGMESALSAAEDEASERDEILQRLRLGKTSAAKKQDSPLKKAFYQTLFGHDKKKSKGKGKDV